MRAGWSGVGSSVAARIAASAVLLTLALAPAPRAEADARTDARVVFRLGMAALAEGRTDDAVRLLWQAYEILPHPNVLYNIGRAEAEAGHYERSIEAFEQYLATDPADREMVEAFISSMRELLGAVPAVVVAQPAEEAPDAGAATVETLDQDAIAAAEEAAGRLEALAEATGASVLAENASRLRAFAAQLRQQPGAALAGPQDAAGAEAQPVEAPAAPQMTLGERSDPVYEEEVVSASRFSESPLDAPSSTTIITAQDIRLSGLTQLGELLRRVAGVEIMSVSLSSSDVSIRGLNQRLANKVLVLLDGRPVRLDFLASPWFNSVPVPLEDIERIEVIRGPASAVYGADAVSGVINIITRTPGEGRSWARVGAGSAHTQTAAAGATASLDRIRFRVSAAYDHADAYSVEVGPDRVDLGTFASVGYPGTTRAMLDLDTRVALAEGWNLEAGSGISQFSGDIQGIGRLRQLRIRGASFQQSHVTLRTPPGVFLRTYWNRFSTAADAYETPPGGLETETTGKSDTIDVELGMARELDLGVPQNVSAGVGYRLKDVRWAWLDAHHREHHAFGYLQDVLRLHERLRLTLSFRVDRHPLLSQLQASPRASLVYRVAEGQSLRLTGGSAFRSPSFLESYVEFENRTPVRGATALGLGNQNLAPERMISFEMGYANQATDYFALEANVYFNLFDNLALLSDFRTITLADFGRGATPSGFEVGYLEDAEAFPLGTLRFANDESRFFQYGGELGVRVFPIAGLDVYANYAYHRTEPQRSQDLVLARRREQRTSPHKVNLGVQYRSRFGLDVAVDLHWVDAQVWAEQVTDSQTGVRFETFDLPAYTLLNGRIGWRFSGDTVEIGLAGTNLLFQEHRQHPFGQKVDTRVVGSVTLRF